MIDFMKYLETKGEKACFEAQIDDLNDFAKDLELFTYIEVKTGELDSLKTYIEECEKRLQCMKEYISEFETEERGKRQ